MMKRTERNISQPPTQNPLSQSQHREDRGSIDSALERIEEKFSSNPADNNLIGRGDSFGAVVKVCGGTSCRLSGAAVLEQTVLRYGHPCQKVYCLGLCDRSPASVMICDELQERERTNVRCAAPKPIVTARILDEPVREIKAAVRVGVYQGLVTALALPPEHLIEQVEESGERGSGGSGILTGKKWRVAAEAQSDKRYVIANGDEGDPGSFVDRVLLEDDPHSIIEGMLLCGYAIGADEGMIYIRSEYPQAISIMREAIAAAREEGFLGNDIYGSGFNFDIRVIEGPGSYVCHDVAALINSIEELLEEVQERPLAPSEHGLYGKPTAINSVETLVSIPFIARQGGAAYAFFGTHASSGTKALCLNHGFAHPGLVEVELGITFREVIERIGGGGSGGGPLAAVLVGGTMGTLLKPDDWDLPVCLEVLSRHNVRLGHGGMVAIPESADFRDLLMHFFELMVRELYRDCASCRLGAQALLDALQGEKRRDELEEMVKTFEQGQLCAFEHSVPGPIRTLISDFGDRIFAK